LLIDVFFLFVSLLNQLHPIWLVWDQSRSKYYLRTKFQDGIDKPQKCWNVCYHPTHQQQSDFLILVTSHNNSWSQNVGQDLIVLDFFHGQKILKVDGKDGRDPQNLEKNAPAGRLYICIRGIDFYCMCVRGIDFYCIYVLGVSISIVYMC
jgi:hypothetical protein